MNMSRNDLFYYVVIEILCLELHAEAGYRRLYINALQYSILYLNPKPLM